MEDLLEQTVVMKGVQIGRVVDLIFGARDELIGFEVRCQDGQHASSRARPPAVTTTRSRSSRRSRSSTPTSSSSTDGAAGRSAREEPAA